MHEPRGTPDSIPAVAAVTHAEPAHGLVVAPHIRLCLVDDQVIVLDLLNNRYSGMAGSAFAAIRGLLERPLPDQQARCDPSPAEASALIEVLRTRGWLMSAGEASTAPPVEVELPEATQTLLPRTPASRPLFSVVHASRCLGSAVSASWRLRHRSLFAIAAGVASRKMNSRNGDESPREEVIDVVSAYLRLRPLLFSARDRCLHDSLTLVTFLAAEGILARWVIGVRVRPFAAHSWVQHEGLVLNDQHERVRGYQPIFVA